MPRRFDIGRCAPPGMLAIRDLLAIVGMVGHSSDSRRSLRLSEGRAMSSRIESSEVAGKAAGPGGRVGDEQLYPALESGDLRDNTLRVVTIAGDSLVFFRDAAGVSRALGNRCPHRGALLSAGTGRGVRAGHHHLPLPRDDLRRCRQLCGVLDRRPPKPGLRQGVRTGVLGGGAGGDHLGLHGIEGPSIGRGVDTTREGSAEPKEVDRPSHRVPLQLSQPDRQRHRSGPCGCAAPQLTLYLPGFVYNAPGEMGMVPEAHSFFWFVPRDIGSFEGWLIIGAPEGRRFSAVQLISTMCGPLMRNTPGADCIYGGDGPMQLSQGRIARWDLDHLARTDRAIVKARRLFQQAHIAELAERYTRDGHT